MYCTPASSLKLRQAYVLSYPLKRHQKSYNNGDGEGTIDGRKLLISRLRTTPITTYKPFPSKHQLTSCNMQVLLEGIRHVLDKVSGILGVHSPSTYMYLMYKYIYVC